VVEVYELSDVCVRVCKQVEAVCAALKAAAESE